MCLETCHFAARFTILWTSIYVFYVKTARDVVRVLLIFAKYLSLYLHIFTCTYRGTHTQAHMYNQHTRGMETTRHRSLVERGGRKALLETLHAHQKKNARKKPIFTNLKKRFEHMEIPAKLLDYFLRRNKSNINQYLVSVSNFVYVFPFFLKKTAHQISMCIFFCSAAYLPCAQALSALWVSSRGASARP